MKYAILASGSLGYKTLRAIFKDLEPVFIGTDSASSEIIKLAEKENVPLFKGNPRRGRLHAFSINYSVDIILSVNYLFLLENDIINSVQYVINFHGSLLPKYRGRTPHVWAIINNEKSTGITAHLIDSGCDTGAIIHQVNVDINYNDTGAVILKKFERIYPKMIKEILYQAENNLLTPRQQQESEATYYGKRTPEDGRINWEWQKERIYNWIRALAYPYPGAFTYYENEKLTIDEIKFSSLGYNFDDENGKILNVDPLIVKTQNGAIEIISHRKIKNKIVKGKILK